MINPTGSSGFTFRGLCLTESPAPPLLRIDNLRVSFCGETGKTSTAVIEDLSLVLRAGQTLGLVGESGCGKSVTAMSIMGLLPQPPARIDGGQIVFDGTDVLSLNRRALQALRGERISMIFQEPMTSLNPVYSIGFQLNEVLRIHRGLRGSEATRTAAIALEQVGIGAPVSRLEQYPHELSGGLRQRVMIAMALLCKPRLLIADEPTTALDVTVQAQILTLLRSLQREQDLAMLLITHDLGIVAELCEQVAVMYAGRVVEQTNTAALFATPAHPYSAGLLQSIPRLGAEHQRLATIAGRVPSPEERTSLQGCYFAPRCHRAQARCFTDVPVLVPIANEHAVACWYPHHDGD